MEDPVIHIGVDLAGADAAHTSAVIQGNGVYMIIIDDLVPEMTDELRQLLMKTIEAKTMHRQSKMLPDFKADYAALEQRILDLQGQAADSVYGWPDKLQSEAPVLKHNVHPKAKAKLPFYHQRRRY